jgi:hypothetical protein
MASKKAPKPPQLQTPRDVPLSETFSTFTGQGAQLPSLQDFASTINQGFRQQLEQGLPGTIGATQQTANLVNQLLSGVPSADQQAVAQRQLAERSLAAGLPATSQAAIFGEAASYGKLSSELQAQGMQAVPGLLQMAEYLNPQQAQNYLFSTGQIRGEELKAAQDTANVANQNAINKYNYDVQNSKSSGGIFGTVGGLLGAGIGSVVMPGVGTALGGMIGGGLGNLAGGGGFQLGAGQAGGAVSSLGQMGTSLFGGGLAGGGGGSYGLPGMNLGYNVGVSYPGAMMSMPTSMVSSYLTPQSMGGFGGFGSYGSKQF